MKNYIKPKIKDIIRIFTDGACRGNPGPGGWGTLLYYNGYKKTLSGAIAKTTNNRMELTAAIKGLNAITKPCTIIVSTDSQYLKNGITLWLSNWRKHNWKRSSGKKVKNIDLWKQLEIAVNRHINVYWKWIKGHNGNIDNELVDNLATTAIDKFLQKDEFLQKMDKEKKCDK